VFEGFAIYNTLKNYKGYKTVYVDGIAASIASVIAMCGNKVVMNKASMLMVHNASGLAYGNADEMKKVVNALEQINEVIRGVYMAKTGMDEDTIKNLMDNETYLKPQEALDYGFIDEILEEEKQVDNTAMTNLMDSFANRINQLREIKNICLETPTQDGVSVVDEEKVSDKKSKMDWLRKGGIF
jgi:ATP-dependent Clp protease protease subunit